MGIKKYFGISLGVFIGEGRNAAPFKGKPADVNFGNKQFVGKFALVEDRSVFTDHIMCREYKVGR